MGNKQTTKQNQTQNQQYNQTSTYGWQTPPDTADVQALRSHQFQLDPTIGARVGGSIRRMQDSYTNPLGGATNPQIRDATMRAQERELMQMGGEQFRAGQYDLNNQQYGQKLATAELTAPRLTQTGQSGTSSGTMSGTSTTSEPWYNGAIQGGASLGSALLM